MKASPQIQEDGTFAITDKCREDDGKISCSGNVTAGTMQQVWGKVVEDPFSSTNHLTPWDDDSTNPPTNGEHDPAWSISHIPANVSGNCVLVVWGVFDGEGGFSQVIETFDIDTLGSCGSGSGSVSAVQTRFPQAERRPVIAKSFDALPRVYVLTFDVQSLDLRQLGCRFLLEGMLCSSAVHLTYDDRVSTPQAPVWRAPNLADANSRWMLRLQTRGASAEAELSLQQISARQVLPALQWHNRNFRVTAENHLLQASAQFQTTPLRMRIRPA